MDTQELVRRLEIANVEYRNGVPVLTDQEYDQLKEKLRELDPNHPLLHKVEGEEQFEKPTVKHPFPMLSTDKSYTIDELTKFFNRIEKKYGELTYKVTPKLDGLAARYNSGMLFTRGDGEVGYDITDAFNKGLRINNDQQLKDGVDYIGEIVMNIQYFNEFMINHFSHPRNVVVGGVKSDELSPLQEKAFKDGAVSFIPFSKLPCYINNSKGIVNNLDFIFEQLCGRVPFLTDGLVIEVYDNDEVKQELGNTSHHYRWQIAYKVQTEKKRTIVEDVKWQTGRGGNITPVLEVDPVEVSGAVVGRVTAHNYGYLKEKSIGAGTVIEIIRSGEVIPKVVNVISDQVDDIPHVYHCPVCGEDTILINDIIKCPNFGCPAQVQGRLQHFFKTLKIDGFGPKTIEKLVQNGHDDIEHIFNMVEEEFEDCGFGPGQSKNLFNSLFDALNYEYEDWKLLAALSIPMLGKSEAKNIVKSFRFDFILNRTFNDFRQLEGFGDKKASVIYEGLQNNSYLLEFIFYNFEYKMDYDTSVNILNGQKFVFTGKMDKSRDEMMMLCEQSGGEPQKSITKSTNYLVTGEMVGKSKLTKAESYGTKIISEDDFMDMIN